MPETGAQKGAVAGAELGQPLRIGLHCARYTHSTTQATSRSAQINAQIVFPRTSVIFEMRRKSFCQGSMPETGAQKRSGCGRGTRATARETDGRQLMMLRLLHN